MGCGVSGPRNVGERDRNEAGSRMRGSRIRQSHQSASTRSHPDGPTAHSSQQHSFPPTHPAYQSPLQSAHRLRSPRSPLPPRSPRPDLPPASPPVSQSRFPPRSRPDLPPASPPVSQPPFPPASPSSSRSPTSPEPHLTRRSPTSPQPPPIRRSTTSSLTRHLGRSSPPVNLPRRDSIMGKPFKNVTDDYTLVGLLGRSRFGLTFLCTENSTGRPYACKAILKKKLVQQSDWDDVGREAVISQHLSGRPGIAKFKDPFEDDGTVFMVMEFCTGRDLYDLISSKGKYTERVIASIIRDIVNVVRVCHGKGVMHRDIKPENFLLSTNDKGAVLLAVDFRHSIIMETAIDGSYGKEIDIWSAGIILYMLLSGVAPFYADTEEVLRRAIQEGNVNFERQPWPSVSNSAKELTRMMLTVNPEQRISPEEVLNFPWISSGGASDEPMHSAILSRLKVFIAMSYLRWEDQQ